MNAQLAKLNISDLQTLGAHLQATSISQIATKLSATSAKMPTMYSQMTHLNNIGQFHLLNDRLVVLTAHQTPMLQIYSLNPFTQIFSKQFNIEELQDFLVNSQLIIIVDNARHYIIRNNGAKIEEHAGAFYLPILSEKHLIYCSTENPESTPGALITIQNVDTGKKIQVPFFDYQPFPMNDYMYSTDKHLYSISAKKLFDDWDAVTIDSSTSGSNDFVYLETAAKKQDIMLFDIDNGGDIQQIATVDQSFGASTYLSSRGVYLLIKGNRQSLVYRRNEEMQYELDATLNNALKFRCAINDFGTIAYSDSGNLYVLAPSTAPAVRIPALPTMSALESALPDVDESSGFKYTEQQCHNDVEQFFGQVNENPEMFPGFVLYELVLASFGGWPFDEIIRDSLDEMGINIELCEMGYPVEILPFGSSEYTPTKSGGIKFTDRKISTFVTQCNNQRAFCKEIKGFMNFNGPLDNSGKEEESDSDDEQVGRKRMSEASSHESKKRRT